MKTFGKLGVAVFSAVAVIAGGPVRAAGESHDHPGAGQPAAAAQIKGKVLESFDSGGYTYVQVDTGSQKVWAATSRSKLKVGDAVSFAGDMPIENFESKSLKRTFEKIYFVDTIGVDGAEPEKPDGAALPPGHPPIGQKGGAAAAALDASKIEKAADGKLIAEIIAGKDALAGKQVTVRGLVVRFNPSILDRNWLRLRDASCKEGSPDLSVTTKAETAVGSIITVSGVLATNKDFGSGYRYDVLVEEATVVGK